MGTIQSIFKKKKSIFRGFEVITILNTSISHTVIHTHINYLYRNDSSPISLLILVLVYLVYEL